MIDVFRERNAFLSNMYVTPVVYQGVTYPSAENAYQAMKCSDPADYQKFINISPSEAKKLGKKITLRRDWEEVKYRFMRSIVDTKFEHPTLRKALEETTYETLIEGNWWHDNYWGACKCDKCRNKQKFNYLGELLMRTRALTSKHPIYMYTIYQGDIVRRSDGVAIKDPSIVYDRDTYTVFKIGNKDVCLEYLANIQGGVLLGNTQVFTWSQTDEFWKYRACEDMNHIMAYTGSLRTILNQYGL